MRTLKELREHWEGDWMEEVGVFVEVPPDLPSYRTVFAILKDDDGFYLYRYFKIGENWEISVDCDQAALQACVHYASERFRQYLPKEEEQ